MVNINLMVVLIVKNFWLSLVWAAPRKKLGDVAQLVERPFCTRKVSGSIPLISTIRRRMECAIFAYVI